MASPNRLAIPDSRGSGASLRVTKHADQRKIVLSHWRDGVCVASTPIDLSEVPALIGLLAEALGEATARPDSGTATEIHRDSVWSKVRSMFRPTLAKVLDLTTANEVESTDVPPDEPPTEPLVRSVSDSTRLGRR